MREYDLWKIDNPEIFWTPEESGDPTGDLSSGNATAKYPILKDKKQNSHQTTSAHYNKDTIMTKRWFHLPYSDDGSRLQNADRTNAEHQMNTCTNVSRG